MSSSGSGVTSSTRAMLDAWRERGADRLDPVRFHFIEALDRRAAGHSGEARRILDDRLSKLLEAYAGDLESAASRAAAASPGEPARGALAGLIDYMAGHAPQAVPRPSSYPELEVLDYFREIWTKLSTERQFRQSLAQVPGNAGPLNSQHLVHRSLTLMQQLSPEYLERFVGYIDALQWLEQANEAAAAEATAGPRRSAALRRG